jgi:hypothetical protein
MQSKSTSEGPTVKVSLRDMVRKAKRDAARSLRSTEEPAKEKIYAVLDEFEKPFPESLPVFVACHRASKKPVAPWKGLNEENWAGPDNLGLLARQILMGGNLAIKLGRDSHNLVTVDLDHDDHIEPFLQATPHLETRCARADPEVPSSGFTPQTTIIRGKYVNSKSTGARKTPANSAEASASALSGACMKTGTYTAE